jgi:hypothetical protein
VSRLTECLPSTASSGALGCHPASLGQNVLPQGNEIAQDPFPLGEISYDCSVGIQLLPGLINRFQSVLGQSDGCPDKIHQFGGKRHDLLSLIRHQHHLWAPLCDDPPDVGLVPDRMGHTEPLQVFYHSGRGVRLEHLSGNP